MQHALRAGRSGTLPTNEVAMIERNLRPGHNTDAGRAPAPSDDASGWDQGTQHDALRGELDLAFLRRGHVGALLLPGLQVTIVDRAGTAILSSTVDVPTLIHASLAQGTYTLIARHGNAIKLRDIEVVPGKTERVLFEWDA
jgi:hypothetical protein